MNGQLKKLLYNSFMLLNGLTLHSCYTKRLERFLGEFLGLEITKDSENAIAKTNKFTKLSNDNFFLKIVDSKIKPRSEVIPNLQIETEDDLAALLSKLEFDCFRLKEDGIKYSKELLYEENTCYFNMTDLDGRIWTFTALRN